MTVTGKAGKYKRIYGQLGAIVPSSNDVISGMATICAVLYHKFNYYFWCGFYRLENGKLIVGPYQGPLACHELKKNTGVCWAGINSAKSIVVPDVHLFPDHIACDSRSRSEIVIPVMDKNGNVIAVMDVDSKELNSFDETDRIFLEQIVTLLSAIK